jgi:hypothetical protein
MYVSGTVALLFTPKCKLEGSNLLINDSIVFLGKQRSQDVGQ